MYRDGTLLIPRLRPEKKFKKRFQRVTDKQLKPETFHQSERALRLHSETPGKPDILYFIDDLIMGRLIDLSEIEVQAEVYGVNLNEALVALGEMEALTPTLSEFVGVVTAVGFHFKRQYEPRNRVYGWGGTAYASRTRVNGHNVHLLPPSMPYKIGASIPVAFITVYYALVNLANLSNGQTVLIRGAADSTGQAALQIAQNIGAVIFATVSERSLLLDTFKLQEQHIFSVKAVTFSCEIKRLTQGHGVNLVVDSLDGEALEDSWAYVAQGLITTQETPSA